MTERKPTDAELARRHLKKRRLTGTNSEES